MIEIPKLVVILLIGFLVWYAMRWVNGSTPKARGKRPAAPRPQPRPQAQVEDLTACAKCGAYVASNARRCGQPGCPQPG